MTPGRDSWWDEACAAAEPVEQAEPMPADAPCLLLYTSGSTGRPKGCVHTHAGLPFKVALEVRHGMGVDRGLRAALADRHGLGHGVVRDRRRAHQRRHRGASSRACPTGPSPTGLWAVAERSGTTVLGISPTVVRALHGPRRDAGPTGTTSPTCGPSARPASRGTSSPGAGAPSTWARAGCRSSTSRAAPRSAAPCSAARSTSPSSRRPSRPHARRARRRRRRGRRGRSAGRSANSSSARCGRA